MSNKTIIKGTFIVESTNLSGAERILSSLTHPNVSTTLNENSGEASVLMVCNDINKLQGILSEVGPIMDELEGAATRTSVQYAGSMPEKLLAQMEPFNPELAKESELISR